MTYHYRTPLTKPPMKLAFSNLWLILAYYVSSKYGGFEHCSLQNIAYKRDSSVSMPTLERSILNSIFHFNYTHDLHYGESLSFY